MKRMIYIFLVLFGLLFSNKVNAASSQSQCNGIEQAGGGRIECESEPNCKWDTVNGCYYYDEALNTEEGKNESNRLNCSQYKEQDACNAVLGCVYDWPSKMCFYSSTDDNSNVSNNNNNNNTTTNYVGPDYIDPSNCGLLGGFKEDLQNILKAIRIVAPILVAFLSAYEYLTVVFMKSADDMKKANKRLIHRLILIAILFFLPTLLNLILSLIETGDYTPCIK